MLRITKRDCARIISDMNTKSNSSEYYKADICHVHVGQRDSSASYKRSESGADVIFSALTIPRKLQNTKII
jgi:hypothetical protein